MISLDHDDNHRLYDPSYNSYSSYPDYSIPSKREMLDYNYWPNNPPTQNILPISSSTNLIDPNSMSSSDPLHVTQMNSTTTISATHHHHHIHQHLYPTPPTDPWYNPSEYSSPPSTYRPYNYPSNTFCDQNQWSTPYSPSSYMKSSHQIDSGCSDSKEDLSEYCLKGSLTPVPPKNPMNGMFSSFS